MIHVDDISVHSSDASDHHELSLSMDKIPLYKIIPRTSMTKQVPTLSVQGTSFSIQSKGRLLFGIETGINEFWPDQSGGSKSFIQKTTSQLRL